MALYYGAAPEVGAHMDDRPAPEAPRRFLDLINREQSFPRRAV
jgi:hypothetical protein